MANDLKRGIRVYLETSDYGKGITDMVAATKKYEASLEQLTAESKKMTAEGKNSGKAWDDLQLKLKRTAEQVKRSQAAEADYQAKLKQTEKVLKNLSGSSYNELIDVQKKLQKEVKAATRGTEEHRIKLQQLERVTKEVGSAQREMNSNLGSSEGGWSKAANGINKYMGMAATGLAMVTGLSIGLKKFMDMRMELEDSQANLKALTGLGDTDIMWLTEQAKLLSTTTDEAGIVITASSKEIMDGFTTIGSKRPELLKNKEAMAAVTKEALILAAAGKMDVATAFDVVTASMNQFNLGADQSNRIINTIAAGSLEGSAEADNLAGSLKNVGTVAKGSNLTLEQTVAALEVLASKQLLGEEAGTKLRGALLKMKDAGVGYVSGAFNMRDAIVELNAKMEEKSTAAERDALLQKVFGAENITAGQILLENVDIYDKLTVAVTGTNVATKQAQINTATVSANLKQAQNKFSELGMDLVKNLNPAMLSATNFTNNFLKLLIQLPKWIKDNIWSLTALAFTWGVYSIAVNASIIADKLKVFWTDKVVFSLKSLTASINANPWGLLATGFILAIGWLNKYLNKQQEVNKEQKKFNDLTEKSNELMSGNKTLEDRAKAMSTLSKSQLETLESDLTTQIGLLSNFDADVKTRALKALREDAELIALKKKYANAKTDIERNALLAPMKWREDALLDQLAQEILTNDQSLATLRKYVKNVQAILKTKPDPKDAPDNVTPDKNAYETALAKKEDAYKESQLELMEQRRKGEMTEKVYNQIALQTQLSFLEEKKTLQQKFKKDTTDTEIEISTQLSNIGKDADDSALLAIKSNQEAGLVALETGNNTKQEMLQEALNTHSIFNGKTIISEREYNLEIKKLASDLALAKLSLAEASLIALQKVNFNDKEKQKKALELAIADIEKLKAALIKAQGDVAKDTAKAVEKSTLTVAERMKGIFGDSFSEIGNMFTSFTESLDKLKNGDLKSWTDWGKAIGDVVQTALAVAVQVNDQYFQYKAAALEADKQRELTNAGDNAQAREDINQKYAQKELDLKKKQSSADTVLKVAQAVAAGGLAIVQAFAQLGPIGGAIAGILIGGITTLQVGTILKQNAAIQATTLDSGGSGGGGDTVSAGARVVTAPQAAEGRWDVMGADDGRTYRNVPYGGVARTGIGSTPTLMFERGDELIVDNPTLRNLRMNAPYVLDAIRKNRVSQRADGNYDALGGSGGSGGVTDNSALLISVVERNSNLLEYLITNGVKAFMLLSEFEKQVLLRDKSLAKGSLK